MAKQKVDKSSLASTLVKEHFGCSNIADLVSASRSFPPTARADLQVALESTFSEKYQARLVGLHRAYGFSALRLAEMLNDERDPVMIAPLGYSEIDVGDPQAIRCLEKGLWLSQSDGLKFVVILDYYDRHGQDQLSVEIAVLPGEKSAEFSAAFLEELEKLVYKSSSYRGKVLSLEQTSRYSGKAGVIKVHKLHAVERDQVILPEKTLKLLERNITQFIEHREKLHDLGMAIKKGLLFYGPPGTGKTHTIHYLASQLPDHTTLLITAGQVGLLGEYFLLARFLQPALIVIEDVDLIARDREDMDNPCAESLLNQLLNEMDGLREDAALLFVLTTNRPTHLEAALASRPGRIDQAIEFPLPDPDGRRKLFHLYSHDLPVSESIVEDLVRRTDRATPAFIKELMRRSAQYFIQDTGGEGSLKHSHVEMAMDDMLFSGGSLNTRLLGAAGVEGAAV